MMADRPGQEGSHETSPTPSVMRIPLSPADRLQVEASIQCLQGKAVVGRIVGLTPTRQQVRDWFQASLALEAAHIQEVTIYGRGVFLVQFASSEVATSLLARSPIFVGAHVVFLIAWYHGFKVEDLDGTFRVPRFPVTLRFPGLPREYRGILASLGSHFGLVLETPPTAATVVQDDGVPKVRVVVQDPEKIPSEILLETLSGTPFPQRVELAGLPGQCLRCREFGHLARGCPKFLSSSAAGSQVRQTSRRAQMGPQTQQQ